MTSVEIVEKTFARIKKLDPHLNAFVCLTEDRALEEARAADVRRSNGASLGPLDGVPYAVKDIYNVSGVATMAGSLLLTDNIADGDCAAVRYLTAAGMVLSVCPRLSPASPASSRRVVVLAAAAYDRFL